MDSRILALETSYIGADGTVFVSGHSCPGPSSVAASLEANAGAPVCTCAWQYWPALLHTQPVGDVCEGLRPYPPGAPVSVKRASGYFPDPEPLLDGEGNVLGGSAGHFNFENTIYAPDGGVLAQFGFPPQSRSDLTVALAFGFAGFRDVSYPPSGPPVLVRLHPDGGLEAPPQTSEATVPSLGFREDPRGGLVLIAGEVLSSYDDNLVPRWSAKPARCGAEVVDTG